MGGNHSSHRYQCDEKAIVSHTSATFVLFVRVVHFSRFTARMLKKNSQTRTIQLLIRPLRRCASLGHGRLGTKMT